MLQTLLGMCGAVMKSLPTIRIHLGVGFKEELVLPPIFVIHLFEAQEAISLVESSLFAFSEAVVDQSVVDQLSA